MSDTVKMMQTRFPGIYNVYDKNTILYTLLSIYADRIDHNINIIDRINGMIGIDTTYDEDLNHRWGSMLGIYKMNRESYSDYRNRLKIVYPSLAGGTANAIKYAIASTIGISDKNTMDECIFVYDAWLYDREIPDGIEIDTSYGNVVCVIDISQCDIMDNIEDRVSNAINNAKASGVNVFTIFLYNAHDECTLVEDVANIMNIKYAMQQDTHSINSIDIMGVDTAVFGRGIFGTMVLGQYGYLTDEYEDIITYV